MQREVIAFLAVLGVAYAAVTLAGLEPKPDKYKDVDGCYIKSLDTVIPVGQARPSSSSCVEYRCGEKWVQVVSCGVVEAAPPLKVVRDLSKPYPSCCPRVVKSHTVK